MDLSRHDRCLVQNIRPLGSPWKALFLPPRLRRYQHQGANIFRLRGICGSHTQFSKLSSFFCFLTETNQYIFNVTRKQNLDASLMYITKGETQPSPLLPPTVPDSQPFTRTSCAQGGGTMYMSQARRACVDTIWTPRSVRSLPAQRIAHTQKLTM